MEPRLEEEVWRCLQQEHNLRALRRGNLLPLLLPPPSPSFLLPPPPSSSLLSPPLSFLLPPPPPSLNHPGMEPRLEEEVWRCLQQEHNLRALRRGNVHCIPTTNRKYLTWKGASTFSTIEGWEDFCITSEEYYEVGKGGCNQLLRGSKILAEGL
jgi:hypothetical protein